MKNPKAPNPILKFRTYKKHTHTHTLHKRPYPQSQRVRHTLSHIILRDNASSVSPPPLPPPALSAPIYLLSATLPVTQRLRPANPFWKETAEQKITSPPLSHTPSLPFVFSSSLLMTSLCHHWATCPPLCLPLFSFLFARFISNLSSLTALFSIRLCEPYVLPACYILPCLFLFSRDVIGWFLNLSQTWLPIRDPAKQTLSKPGKINSTRGGEK